MSALKDRHEPTQLDIEHGALRAKNQEYEMEIARLRGELEKFKAARKYVLGGQLSFANSVQKTLIERVILLEGIVWTLHKEPQQRPDWWKKVEEMLL